MGEYPAGRKAKKYDFLGGGLVTRPDDRYITQLNDQGHFYSPAETNVQFTKIASMQKRLGYALNGADVQNAVWLDTGVIPTISTGGLTALDNQVSAQCYKLTAPSTANIISLQIFFNIFPNTMAAKLLLRNIVCVIKADSAGSPGTTLGTSNALTDGLEISGTLAGTNFYFPSNVALTSATVYWVCVQGLAQPGATAGGVSIRMRSVTSPPQVIKNTNDGYATFTSINTDKPRIKIYTSAAPVLGLYDYSPQAAGVITQFPMMAVNGTLYYYNAGYTSIKTGLSATANLLYDFSTLKNYLFVCDYATSNNQVWDGAAAATMTHGYRPTVTIAQSASAGGPWSAAGIVKVFLVTTLVSGGYRISAVKSITLSGTTQKIDLTYAIDAVAAQYSFDIAATATVIYCTLPNGSIYYKVPAASLSTAGNPVANTQTTNSILPTTDANLIAGGTFESNLSYPQGYATGQVDTPKAKFFEVFQNMLASAGDPNNPSRVWLTEQGAPQVYGNGDSGTGIQGDFLDIATNDGDIITGLLVSDGALLVGKNNSIYRVDFTGNAVDSYTVNKVHGQVGVLSNWSMQIIPEGMFFLSARGPAICYGTYSDVLPQTRMIQDLFDNTSSTSFNLASMIYAVAMNDTTRNQVLMTVSSPSVSIRDRILSYDYEQKMFALYDGYQANYLANIGDSNGFPVLWTGNLSGQVFTRSSTYLDNGAAIIVAFQTPDINFGEPTSFSQVDFLHIAGTVQTSGNLYIDFFANGSSNYYRTVSIDMTAANFALGVAVRVGAVGKGFSFRIRSVDFTGVSGMELHWIRVEYSGSSGTRMG